MHNKSLRPAPCWRAGLELCAGALVFAAAQAHAEAPPSVACRYQRVGNLAVDWQDDKLMLDGSVNGKPARMMVDSGAQSPVLTRHGVERLDIPVTHSEALLVGSGGESRAYAAFVKDIDFGAEAWHDAPMKVIWQSTADLPYDAIVGANVLFQHDVELSRDEHRLSFFASSGCADTPLAYWAEAVPSVEMKPLGPADARQVIEVQVNAVRLRALLDTGAWHTHLNLAAARALGFDPNAPDVRKTDSSGVGTHTVDAWLATFDTLQIGAEKFIHPHLVVQDLWGSAADDARDPARQAWASEQPEMVIGADFFTTHRVLFAPSQSRLYFSYLAEAGSGTSKQGGK